MHLLSVCVRCAVTCTVGGHTKHGFTRLVNPYPSVHSCPGLPALCPQGGNELMRQANAKWMTLSEDEKGNWKVAAAKINAENGFD